MPNFVLGGYVTQRVYVKQDWYLADDDLPEYFDDLKDYDLVDFIIGNGEMMDCIDSNIVDEDLIEDVEFLGKI